MNCLVIEFMFVIITRIYLFRIANKYFGSTLNLLGSFMFVCVLGFDLRPQRQSQFF